MFKRILCNDWNLSKLHSILYDSLQSLGYEKLGLIDNEPISRRLQTQIPSVIQVPSMMK